MESQELKNKVFIIDGSSFLYRAFYSIRTLTTRDGTPVNAVFGFCRMIKKLIDTYKSNYMIVAWDSKGKTVRHEMYEAYKDTRMAMPSDLSLQKQIILEFVETIGLKQIHMQSVEADDLMYSIAKELASEGQESVIVTSDKDMGQALNASTIILDPFKDEFVTRESLETKLGFALEKLPFYFALIGDSSDNIPGVRGIGPKGATSLVQQFESLEDLYKNIDKVKSARTQELLKEYKADAFLSEQLFILRFYETCITKKSCEFNIENWAKAYSLFEKLEFKSLLKDAPVSTKDLSNLPHLSYKFIPVTTAEQLNVVYNEIIEAQHMALDTEGLSLNPLDGAMVGLSVCTKVGVSYYIPFGHKTTEPQLSKEYVLNTLRPLFEDSSIKKFLHHAKFDALMFYNEGIELSGIAFDTIIAASLLVADGQRIGLKHLSEYYFKEPMLNFKDVVNKNKYRNFSYVPISLATDYAAADAHQTMKLYEIFNKTLHKENLDKLFYNIEMPLMQILYKMECSGIILDTNILNEIDIKVSAEIGVLHNAILDLIGIEQADINLNSPKQLEDLLFNVLNLPRLKKTTAKTGFSTDQEVLKELSKIHPVPALIIRYRELYKLKSTYIDALPTFINKKSKRVHTSFNQTAVATGRLASSEPNLQNIPVDHYHIRSSFKAKEDSVLLSSDYSQIELRVLGYLSQDSALINAFNNNMDIHALTAGYLFDIPINEITSTQRNVGKRINFSILYGLTAHGLSKDMDISHSEAKKYIEKYMAQFQGVSAWMENVVIETKEKGYVQTLFGRRRYLPGINESNRLIYDLSRRVAINTVAQGTAAELMKIGMINLDKAIIQNNLHAKILLQIHDELILEVPESELQQTQALVTQVLESVVDWNLPLVVNTRSGKNWQEITK